MKKYTAKYSPEAEEQFYKLQKTEQKKLFKAVNLFELLGVEAKNTKHLDDDLFEIKVDKIRAYFKYFKNKIIIIGIVVLKKTQKAPVRYIEQAHKNIEKYIKEVTKNGNK
jgi:phage-related protein